MEITKKVVNDVALALVASDDIIIHSCQDALNIMGDCSYNGMQHIVMLAENFSPDFFDLKTGLAGEILQKFSTYNLKLAIVGDFSDVKSHSLRSFIYESNRYGRVIFVDSHEQAEQLLTRV